MGLGDALRTLQFYADHPGSLGSLVREVEGRTGRKEALEVLRALEVWLLALNRDRSPVDPVFTDWNIVP